MQPGGKATLSYTGVTAKRPPDSVIESRPPTDRDINFIVPTLWIDYPNLDLYILVNVAGTATWIYIPTNVADEFITDSGTAVPDALGDINVFGGTGITTSASGNTITISSVGAGFDWTVVTAATQTLAPGNAYLANAGGGVTFSLPATAAVGDTFIICGMNAGGWVLDQQTGQTVDFNGVTTTTTTGTLTSTRDNDQIILVCSVADTEFVAFAPVGNLLVDGATSNNSINSTTLNVDVNADIVTVGEEGIPAKLNINGTTLPDEEVFGASLTTSSSTQTTPVANIEARSTGTTTGTFGASISYSADDANGDPVLIGEIGVAYQTNPTGPNYTTQIRMLGLDNSTVPTHFLSVRPLQAALAKNNAFFAGALSSSAALDLCGVTTNDRRHFLASIGSPAVIGPLDLAPVESVPTVLTTQTSSTSTVSSGWEAQLDSTGTPSAGFGSRLAFSLETSTPSTYDSAVAFGGAWATPTAGAVTSRAQIWTRSAGGAFNESLRITNDGISTDQGTTTFAFSSGTFTPTISGSTSPGAGTYTIQVGRFSRSGPLVYVFGNMTWTAHTGTGNGQLTNLPFTALNVAQTGTPGVLFLSNYTYTAGSTPVSIVTSNSTIAGLNEYSPGGAAAALALDTAATLRYGFNYFIG